MENNVIQMHRFVGSDNYIPPQYRPRIKMRGGIWRIDRIPFADIAYFWREAVSEANDEALLFSIYLNQFLPGGFFAKEEKTTTT